MKSRVKNRLILIVVIIMALLFFSSDFSLIDIEKTAIIVAIGIDKDESDIIITAQIGVPHATEEALDNSDTLITGSGKTVMEAINNISKQTGWYPKLSFCNMIIFGNGIANDNIQSVADHLLASERFQNSALLAVSETSAKEFLSTQTPLDAISSFAIEKVLVENGAATTSVLDTNIKDFSKSVHGRNAYGYMPYIRIIDGAINGEEEGSSAVTGLIINKNIGDNGLIDDFFKTNAFSGSGGQSENNSPTAVYDASRTAIFVDGKIADILTKDETIAFNLLKVDADRVIVSTKAGDEYAALEIFDSRHKISVSYGKRPTLKLDLNITVRIADGTGGDEAVGGEDSSLGRRATVPQKYCDSVKDEIRDILTSLFERMTEKNIDLFSVRDMTYKYHNAHYEDYKKIPLSSYALETDISVTSKDDGN